jgi:hypothetical protein
MIYSKDMTIFLFSTVVSDTFVGHIKSCQMSYEFAVSNWKNVLQNGINAHFHLVQGL